jgi:predicted DNA-binding transcriptional regulator YafY
MSDSVLRMIKMTELIKRYPVKVTATEIKQGLDNFGYETSLRTVQRDLNELSRIFPIECDDRSTPFGWSWKKDSPGYEFPAMDPIQALTFSLAAQYLEPLMPKASFKRVEKFFKRAEKVLTGNEKSNVLRWRKRVRVIPETIRFKEAPVKSEIRQKIYQAL